MTISRRPNSREAILDATEQVVLDLGAAHMTLDAVAKKAGLGKGGLLYHFPTKNALLSSLIGRYIQRCEQEERKVYESLPAEPNRELRSYVLASLSCHLTAQDRRINAALLAAIANEPSLVEPVRARHCERVRQLCAASTLAPQRVTMIALAVDGFWMLELMQLCVLDADNRQAIVDELLTLLDSDPSTPQGS